MKGAYLICGFLTLLFTSAWLISNYRLLDLKKYGKVVSMKIIDKPTNCLGTIAHYNMTVVYKGKTYIKYIGSSICDQYQIGDSIRMIQIEGENQIFYTNESLSLDFVIVVSFFFSGIALALHGFGFLTKPPFKDISSRLI